MFIIIFIWRNPYISSLSIFIVLNCSTERLLVCVSTGHNGFWGVWNLAKKFGKFLYKNLPIYKEKTWQKWSSVDPHCSLVTHSAKGRFKWKNWLFIMPFCHLLSILAAFLIANCDFWLKTTWLTFLKRFMTENWPKQKKSKKVSTRDRTGDLLCGSQMW